MVRVEIKNRLAGELEEGLLKRQGTELWARLGKEESYRAEALMPKSSWPPLLALVGCGESRGQNLGQEVTGEPGGQEL